MGNQLLKLARPRISVAIATYNEEKNIGPCLESVKHLADEVVIVDGSSTDRTVGIAKKYGVKVIVTTNPPIFHLNKQKAIDKCQGDWILQLDADERVTPALRAEILPISNQQSAPRSGIPLRGTISNQPVAYYIPRKNYFLGKWLRKGGQYPDYVIRFFERSKAYLPCKSVHEQMRVKGEVGYLKSHLEHYTAPIFSRYLTNANRYTSLTAREMKRQKIPISLLTVLKYLWLKPLAVFISLYFRHKGFIDGWRGFIFALFSGLHYPWAFVKYWRMKR